ncbi:hypothetical protein [Burkholderia gladioli]|uniref:hypothetical protein n=1 Tax=Burkholderia gladioli TaxID=28095 RepID=UPI00163E6664|nr:hypothetical protein [Burkholderia gladioli]
MSSTIKKSDLLRGIRLAAMSSSVAGKAQADLMLAYLIGWFSLDHPDVAKALADAAGIEYQPPTRRAT